jgi:hypothetical protein
MGIYKRIGAAGFVLPSRDSYYAHTYSVFEVRQPRNLYRSAAHVRAHHACHRLHFGGVLPTIGGTRGARSAWRGSVFGFRGSTEAVCFSDLKVRARRFARQPPLANSRIGTHRTVRT